MLSLFGGVCCCALLLFVEVRCVLFVVRHWLLFVGKLFVVRCSLFLGCCWLLFGVCYFLGVVCCYAYVVLM